MVDLDPLIIERMQFAVQVLHHHAEPVAAFLFGSRAEGRGDSWSDYDLAVFVKNAETWDLETLVRCCSTVQQEAGDDIELHVFPASLLYAPPPASFAAYIIAHGIRLPLEDIAA